MECQRKKYLKLWHQKYQGSNSGIGTGGHSNQDQASKTKIKCWVVNLSTKPLSTAHIYGVSTGLAHVVKNRQGAPDTNS